MHFIKNTLYCITLSTSIIFILWRNNCSIKQIKTYYDKSNVKKILNFASEYNTSIDKCFENKKNYQDPLFLNNFIHYEEPFVFFERLLELQHCLTSYRFVTSALETISSDSFRNNNKQLIPVYNVIANEFDRQPNINSKKQYLLTTLETLNDNNAIVLSNIMFQEIKGHQKEKTLYKSIQSLLFILSENSDIIKSLKNGNYVMNIIDTVKIEISSNINKLLFTIKDSQNKTEYFIKQVLLEISYILGLLINYIYFVLWTLSFLGIWVIVYFRILINFCIKKEN
jgi:hypothetical protein